LLLTFVKNITHFSFHLYRLLTDNINLVFNKVFSVKNTGDPVKVITLC